MMNVITASERHLSTTDLFRSYNLLSFADYFDPTNVRFGPLRTFNDNFIAPNAVLPQHAQAEMEIVTIVLKGEITHTDSLGNEVTLGKGDVQRLTAGTGISHSLANQTNKEVHLLQLWFEPNSHGLNPSYEERRMDFLDADDELIPLVSGQRVLEDVLFMNSNSTVYYGKLDKDKEINFNTFKIRMSFIYMLEGQMFVNGNQIGENDQLRLADQDFLTMKGTQDASFIMVDVPAVEANY